VLDVEHRQEHAEDFFLEFVVGKALNLSFRSLGVECESKSLANSESREMVVIFLVVDDLTT
jgi:hypothetical protein